MKHSAMDLCEYELKEQVSAAGKLSLKTRDTNIFKPRRDTEILVGQVLLADGYLRLWQM